MNVTLHHETYHIIGCILLRTSYFDIEFEVV